MFLKSLIAQLLMQKFGNSLGHVVITAILSKHLKRLNVYLIKISNLEHIK